MDYKRSVFGRHSGFFKVLFVAAVIFAGYLWLKSIGINFGGTASDKGGFEAAVENYGREVKLLAYEYNLSPEYLMALIMLESSGRKDVPPRFEPAVYQKLKDVQEKRLTSMEYISYNDIADASDEALRNLASSWGPFQLMGYKCLHLGVKIKDLRGINSLYWGVFWIDKTYGDYIRKGRYEDAFHIHNTGHPVPKNGKHRTYDPDYVKKGLEYMEYFKEKF